MRIEVRVMDGKGDRLGLREMEFEPVRVGNVEGERLPLVLAEGHREGVREMEGVGEEETLGLEEVVTDPQSLPLRDSKAEIEGVVEGVRLAQFDGVAALDKDWVREAEGHGEEDTVGDWWDVLEGE